MISKRLFIVSAAVLVVAAGLGAGLHWRYRAARKSQVDRSEMFTKEVLPVLEHSCIKCHGPEKQAGDLRLDSLAAIQAGGRHGTVLVPGDVSRSLLAKRIHQSDPALVMPPKSKLRKSSLAAIDQWITAGAPWPQQAGNQSAKEERRGDAWSDPENPITKLFDGKRLDLWSLQPLADPAPPTVRNPSWVKNPVDAFVLARLEAAGKSPAPEADRRTLVRRLYFDLTGLPPAPEEVAQFLANASPDAYDQLVEKLLNSRAYGEQAARGWLDVVRYSDSNGFDYDEFRPQAWRFRDYVIRSFNADKPYDQFVREQMAGDEMVAGAPESAEDQDRLIATGFLRVGPYDNSAALFGESDRCRAQVMFDMVETTGAAFMGMNLSCCRCHDHKVDPLSQNDYYRLKAVFENVVPNDKLLLDTPEAMKVIQPEVAAIDQLKEQHLEIEKSAIARITHEKTLKLPEEDQQLLTAAEKNLPAAVEEHLQQLKRTIHTTPVEAKAGFNEEEAKHYAAVTEGLKDWEKKRSPYTAGYLVSDAGYWAPPTPVFSKGDYTQPRETVPPGTLSVLDPNPLPAAQTARQRTSGRRTALADWLFSENNPLTARVMVNRLWQSHFGEGLQATPNDFGFAGARPTDPALLDWLAREFRRGGWSMKKMHRLLVTSATYRQAASAIPPERDSLATHRSRRLTAEEWRDAMLAVAGHLLVYEGGPPLWPELPEEVLSSNPGLLVENEEKTRGWYPSPKEKTSVRSIYLVQKRSLRLPMMETFDLPESNVSCGRRSVSTVAPQALTLLNSPFAAEVAAALAARLQQEAGEAPQARIVRAFSLTLQRPPDATELADSLQFLHQSGLPAFCRVMLNLNEFAYVD